MPTFILQSKLATDAVASPRSLEELVRDLPGRPEWATFEASL